MLFGDKSILQIPYLVNPRKRNIQGLSKYEVMNKAHKYNRLNHS